VHWYAYVLVSARGRTYVGTTTDVARRLRQHNGELVGGARSTRAGRPWMIGRVLGPFDGRGPALRVELALRRVRGVRRLSIGDPGAALGIVAVLTAGDADDPG
jgi:putative endonuclease